MKYYFPTSRGFTLIETLFAILIFSAALISLLAISSKGISVTNQVKRETIAYYLAQEGLEVVRTIRDTNMLAAAAGSPGINWTDGFATPGSGTDCTTSTMCYVVYGLGTTPSLAENSSSGVTAEIFFSPSGQYSNTGTPTGFFRNISVTPVSSTDEFMITATVTWKMGTINRSVTLQTFLKKWQ